MIKSIKFFLLFQGAALAVLCLTACSLPTGSQANGNYSVVNFESKIFNVQRADTEQWYEISALKLAEGAYCVVYVSDTELESVSPGLARYIAAEYDTNIYGAISGIFGDYMAAGFDVDADGKTTLLLLDILDGYSGSGGYVAGYFDSTHMYNASTYVKSNQADMLFIDVKPQSPRGINFYVTLAHELQHLINFALHKGKSQEIWLNEGLSSAAEYHYGGHQWSRINYFNADPMGTIAQGNNFFVWDGHWENGGAEDLLANYATVYLFFQWLRIQGGGPSIYTEIAGSDFRDYQALTHAAKDRFSGITATDDAEMWDRLLSSWMIANYRNDPSPSLYGYKEEWQTVKLKRHTIVSPLSSVSLFPGEGVFSGSKGAASIPDGSSGLHINYLAMGTGTVLPIGSSLPPGNDVLLSYNANTSSGGPGEEAYIYATPAKDQSLTQGATTGRSAFSPEALPESYPIGVHDLRRPASADPAPAPASR
ncbi:MAG: hypothetical protein LBU00_06155 [Treponema sp.]|nr:hypothetical protein [Treponema sp.]